MSKKHRLVENTLHTTRDGIVAGCVCGWKSRPHFSSFSASIAFKDHAENGLDTDEERIAGRKAVRL
jgi:hypothetical protein